MGQAREVADRVTEAVLRGDEAALLELYAPDAVADTPEQGRITSGAAVTAYLMEFQRALPDLRFELTGTYEAGNTAIDEGYVVGTNTGPLALPDGSEIAPTGRAVRVRECDICTVENGRVTSHRFYYDQLDFLRQLGLAQADAQFPAQRFSAAAAEPAAAPGPARA